MLRTTEALMANKLSLAEANTQDALELAKQINDPKILEVVKSDQEILKKLIAGSLSDTDFHQLTLAALGQGSTEDPTLLFHRNYVVSLASIFQGQTGANLKCTLEEMHRAAQASGDQASIEIHKKLELFVRLCFANDYFEEPSDEEFEYLKSTLPIDSGWDSQSMICLNRLVKGDFDATQFPNLNQDDASTSPINRLLAIKLLEARFHCQYLDENDESAVSNYTNALKISRDLGSPALTLDLERKLLRLRAEFSDDQGVQKSTDAVLNNPAYPFLSISSAHDTNVLIQDSRLLVDPPNAKDVTRPTNYYPKKEEQESRKKTEVLNQAYIQWLEARRNNENDLKELKVNNQAVVDQKNLTLSRLRIYSIAATLALLGLLPCLFLFLQQKRIKNIKHELASEQHRVQASEAKVDGLTNRLSRIERMNSLGLMAGGIAHDFNNLLVGILGNAELIQMMGDDAGIDFINQRVTSIRESAEKAADISRNMLAYAGRQPIERREVNLNDLIMQFEGVLTTACLPTQSLNLVFAENDIRVSIDQTMAERSILNLVKNASQFSAADGSITIFTRVVPYSETDHASSLCESTHRGDFAVIEIKDFGRGVSEEQQEHIFEPFYTTRETGRGLGLAVVYGFAKSHDGIVKCTSSPSAGTCFRLELPLVPNRLEIASVSPDETLNHEVVTSRDDTDSLILSLHGAGKTVLMIDDDKGVVDVCQKLLEVAGWKVIVAVSGQEGLEKMHRHQNEIHCVLLDIVMPDMSAGEVLNDFEAKKILVPVVLVSGFSKIQLESYYARPNVTAIIAKPFRNRDILAALFNAAMIQELEKKPSIEPTANPQNTKGTFS